MALYIFIFLFVVIGGVWLYFLAQYYKAEMVIHALQQGMQTLLKNRLNSLPILLSLMTPFVIKREEVFYKILHVRKELLYATTLQDPLEHDMSQQIHFLFQIAEKHEDLIKDPQFIHVQQQLLDIQKQLGNMLLAYEKQCASFATLKKKSLFFLFPGYYFFKVPQQLQL